MDGEKHCLPTLGGEGDPQAMAGGVIIDSDSLQDRDLRSGSIGSSRVKSSQEFDMVIAF